MIGIIINSLNNRKWKFILVTVQFFFGFCALLFGLASINNLLQYKRNVEKLAPLDAIHLFINTQDGVELTEETMLKYENIMNQIAEISGIDKFLMFEQQYIYSPDNVNESEKQILLCNKDFLDSVDWELSSGKMDELITYNKKSDIVPVIIHSTLSDVYHLGETYRVQHDSPKGSSSYSIKVVGILDKSFGLWTGGASMITDTITCNKSLIIAPKFKEFETDIPYIANSLFEVSKETNKEYIVSAIDGLLNQNDMSAEYKTIEDEVMEYYARQKVIVVATMSFSIIILILSVLGCIGTILSNVLSRKKEFGVYFTMGFTLKHIMILIIGEIGSVFLGSFTLASIVSTLGIKLTLSQEGFAINSNVLLIAFLVMAICTFFCVLLPIRRISMFQPINLLNGRDN